MEISSIPRFAPGCRLHRTEEILLVPEGTLNLSGPAREILLSIDGRRTVHAIVDDLLLRFDGANEDEVTRDVLHLLSRMQLRGAIRE